MYFGIRYYQKRRRLNNARRMSALRADALRRDIEAAAANGSRPEFSDMVQVNRNPFLDRRRAPSPPPPPPPYSPDMPRTMDAAYLGGGLQLPMYSGIAELRDIEEEEAETSESESTNLDEIHNSERGNHQQNRTESESTSPAYSTNSLLLR